MSVSRWPDLNHQLVLNVAFRQTRMAGTVNSTVECDAENLKHLLNETAAACQKCLLAVDTVVASQRQGSLSTVNYASVSPLCCFSSEFISFSFSLDVYFPT